MSKNDATTFLRVSQIASHIQRPQITDYPLPHVAATTPNDRLKGKVAILTGCNSHNGIGRATAMIFAAAGAKAVVLCDVSGTNLAKWAEEIGSMYPQTKVGWKQFDASDESAVKQVIDETVAKYGHLDVYFANAGVPGGLHMDAISPDGFMNTFKVNTLGVFLAIKYASKAMRQRGQGGSIIATASVAGLRAGAGGSDYSASKAAVINLVQTSAWQLYGTAIRVNAICPGLIDTGMTAPVFQAARARGTEQKIGQLNPTARYGVSDEMARVVLFLASDEASFVNGQAWIADGGYSSSNPVIPGKLA